MPSSEANEILDVSKEEIAAKEKADAYTLDRQFGSEEVDAQWAAKIERVTVEAVARLGPKVQLTEVACRETLCRARVTHVDTRSHDDDVERLLTLPIFPGQAFAYAPPDDQRTTVLYFSRKGVSLSVLQPPVPVVLPRAALLDGQEAEAEQAP